MPHTAQPHPTREAEDQNLWNFLLSAFFAAVLVAAMWEIWGEHGTFPRSVPLFDAVLMALAAFRITRLVVYDKIARWFRELFVERRHITVGGERYVELIPYKKGLLRSMHDLVGCPWCIGFWSSILIVFAYYTFDWAWFIILFLAIAGASSFVQISANWIGWQAERAKLEAKRIER